MSNLPKVKYIANKLTGLKEPVVFVGGAIVELLLDEKYQLTPRMSDDVDTIIEVYTRSEFAKVEKSLRSLGFKHVIAGHDESSVICRFEIDGVKLDIMPTNPDILGFSNIWYESAFKGANEYPLSDKCKIRLITAPYFLATKFEAFLGRGENDFHGSHDLEDIITLLDGRDSILEEINVSDTSLKEYLRENFSKIVKDLDFINALPGHLSPYGSGTDARVEMVLSKIKKLCES